LAVSVKVIFAPRTLAPVESVTLPFSWLVDCAIAKAARNANTANTQIARLVLCMHRTPNWYHAWCCLLLARCWIRVIDIASEVEANAGAKNT
jgi:hypothetical protein